MWVERGDASAGGKIVYSSTFDAVVDAGCEEDLNPTESSTALFNVAVSPAVNATVDGRLGCVLCVGSGPDKRQALFDACGEPAISGLLAAAEDKGFSLAVCGLLVFWERLYDLLDDARPIEGPPSASATGGGSSPRPLPGLLGATTRTVSSAADGAALIASLPALATKAEEDIVGAAVAGHLAVQLSLHDSATGEVVGRTLLVDVADATASAAAPSLLASTLCHASATMLQKALAKPSTRPAACDATVLTRILAPVFDHPASTTSRLVLNVTADAPQGTVDVLRTAQAAAGGKIGSKGKDRAAKESADRRSSVTEHLQRVISECADKPPVESDVLAESLKQAMGDVAELQKELAECVNERNVTDVELDKLKASRDAGANGSAETEAERQMAEWAAEEEALAAQLAAERDEAEKLLKLLQEHEGKGGGESGAEELREQDHIVAASEEEAIEEAAARAQVFVSKQFTNFVPNLANIEVLPPIKVVERLRTTLEAYDLERRRLFYLADMDKGHLKTKGSVPERVQRTIDELFVLENALGGMGKTMRDAQRRHQKLVKEARPAREVAERAAIDGEEDDDDYGDVFDDDDFGEEVGDEFGVDDDDIASQRSGEGAST